MDAERRKSQIATKRRRRSHARNCPGKQRYQTREDALAAKRGIGRRSKGRQARMQVYRCLDCRRYHLGTDATDSVLRLLDQSRKQEGKP